MQLPVHRETVAIHGGTAADDSTRALAVPIHQTAAYEFDSAAHAAALFNLEADGFRYSRISNPTCAVLERRISLLEGGAQALAVASGQAAIHTAITNLTGPGSNFVSVPQLYGTTHTLFAHTLRQQGVSVRFAADDSAGAIEGLIDADTRAVFCESVGNPAGNVCDIAQLADAAHARGVPLLVDNTVATPMLLRPIEHGADIVVHSLTKFMGGHGTTLGGIIVDAGRFDWRKDPLRFPMFNEPDESYHNLIYAAHFGMGAFIARARSALLRTTGAVLSPFNAFLLLQGIETLSVRIDRHVENARKVAGFLRADPRVAWVSYAGFADSPYHALLRRYLDGRAPSLLTFGVRGGLREAAAVYDALRLIKRVVNLGDVKSLACHPASTTHRQMDAAQQKAAGVTPEMIRLSIGIEHAADIVADLDQALEAARSPGAAAARAVVEVA